MTVKEFLNSHGQGVEQVDVKACLSAFAAEAKKGFGGVSSIPMIPTYLMNVDRSLIKTGVKRILIDAGGTNFRAAVGYFDDLGEARIGPLPEHYMLPVSWTGRYPPNFTAR